MGDLNDEFRKFLNTEKDKENFLRAKLEKAISILKAAYPFIETWYKSSHAGLGDGARAVMISIDEFLREIE